MWRRACKQLYVNWIGAMNANSGYPPEWNIDSGAMQVTLNTVQIDIYPKTLATCDRCSMNNGLLYTIKLGPIGYGTPLPTHLPNGSRHGLKVNWRFLVKLSARMSFLKTAICRWHRKNSSEQMLAAADVF